MRPTVRCVKADLGLPLPLITEPLDELNHVLVEKGDHLLSSEAGGTRRITSIDDEVLLKVKVDRWRGAAWSQRGPEATDDSEIYTGYWLVAAGTREDGSLDDFYQSLATDGQRWRKQYNASQSQSVSTDTYVAPLLPNDDDHDRFQAEAAIRVRRSLQASVRDAAWRSFQNGREQSFEIAGATVGILVRADDGYETYVSIRITGPLTNGAVALILDAIPGCDSWNPEIAGMPGRPPKPNEQFWSTIMDISQANELFENDT